MSGVPDAWRVAVFRVSFRGTVRRLADACVVPDNAPQVLAALAPPYWRSPEGASWCDETKTTLRAAGLLASRNYLARGWRRYLLRERGGHQRVVCLPPDFPAVPARVLRVVDARRDHFELVGEVGPGHLEELDLLGGLT